MKNIISTFKKRSAELISSIYRRTPIPCPTRYAWLVEIENPFARNLRSESICAGDTVLDCGCGPGRVSIPLARQVGVKGRVVSMDIQEGMLTRTKEKADKLNLLNIDYLHSGLGENKLGSSCFDVVLLVTVLGEIPSQFQSSGLKELHTALKPNGILSITETIFDPDYLKPAQVIQLARDAGFDVKSKFGNFLSYTINFKKHREASDSDNKQINRLSS